MVIRQIFFFSLLGTIFFGLLCWLITLQLPTDYGFFALFQPSDQLDLLLLQSYALPRITIAILAGGALGLASLLLQQVMANPLASDNTLGISSGAQFALFIVAIFVPDWLDYGASLIGLIGAGLSLVLVLSLAMRKTISPLLLILAGLVVNLYFGSFSAMMMLFFPEESRGLAQWGAGSLVQESWRESQLLAVQILAVAVVIGLLLRPFTLLSLNDANAQSLGVPVAKLRLIGVILSTVLIAGVVSSVGMLGFVGLAAATIIRQLGVRTFKWQLIGAFGAGALLLAITDLGLQLLSYFYQMSLPTGAVTALLGTPLLLWLMFRALPTGRVVEQPLQKIAHFRPLYLGLILVSVALVLIVALFVGKNQQDWQWSSEWALLELRYPRILVAFGVGILLAVAGVILQQLTLNPMASPELLGVSAGTSMGVLAVIFLFIHQTNEWIWLAGAIGALITLAILTAINQRNGMLPEKVLLTGISLSALFDTLQRIAIASGDPRANQLILWTSGSTQQIDSDFALPFLSLSLVLLLISLLFSRWLALLGLQAPMAQALGLNLKHCRWVLILFSAVLTALATLVIGPLSFIGLLVPQITRTLGVHKAHHQILISACLGGLMMVFADWLGRQMLFPYEVPAGLVATLIGGSYFLLMVRKI